MSLRIINNLVQTFCTKLKANVEDVEITSINLEKEFSYEIVLILNNVQYSIRHFEPTVLEKNVNYGDGHYHDYSIYNIETDGYERFDIDDLSDIDE